MSRVAADMNPEHMIIACSKCPMFHVKSSHPLAADSGNGRMIIVHVRTLKSQGYVAPASASVSVLQAASCEHRVKPIMENLNSGIAQLGLNTESRGRGCLLHMTYIQHYDMRLYYNYQ